MRVLYGVCGEGFGHSSRAGKVIEHLLKKGNEVLVVTYGQAYDVLKKYPVVRVPGLKMVFEKGKLSTGKTITYNVKEFFKDYKPFFNLKREVEKFKPDVCITDMEPLVPIVSNYYNLPLISLDNQHRITHLNLKVPRRYFKDYIAAKSVVHRIVARADAFIILSFAKQKAKKGVFVVEPLLREEVLKLKPTRGRNILVYQSRIDENLLKILKQIPETFVVYGYEKEKKEGNLIFKKFGAGFLKDLASTKAVIGTAGFSLMSEAVYLKKPYFAIPLKGQFEQILNSLFWKKAGFGEYSDKPQLEEIKYFLSNLEKYEKNLRKHKMNSFGALKVLDKVLGKYQR